MVGLRGGFDDRQNLERVKADGARQNDQLDNVDPAFATLNARHERLMALEPVRQIVLAQACAFTRVDQRTDERQLAICSDCFCHASHTFCDVASG
jgi:hypothetical protein